MKTYVGKCYWYWKKVALWMNCISNVRGGLRQTPGPRTLGEPASSAETPHLCTSKNAASARLNPPRVLASCVLMTTLDRTALQPSRRGGALVGWLSNTEKAQHNRSMATCFRGRREGTAAAWQMLSVCFLTRREALCWGHIGLLWRLCGHWLLLRVAAGVGLRGWELGQLIVVGERF